MNDLTQYYKVRDRLQVGDIVVYWGSKTNPLSFLIEEVTGGPSHTQVVRQSAHGSNDVKIVEATIEGKQNGIQSHFLSESLAGYPAGSSAAALILSDERRAILNKNLEKFYEVIGACDGVVHYSVADLFAYLLPSGVEQTEHKNGFVCSTWGACLLDTCGVVSNINWSRMRPQDVVELGIYKEWLPLLGNPQPNRFNTVF